MPVHAMNHFTVLTDDLERTTAFYERILGLTIGERPPLGFPGAWMYTGGQAVLHIVAGRSLPASRAGVLDHMAFSGTGLAATATLLRNEGIEYVLRRLPGSGLWQMFFHDPSGAKVEIDFDATEAEPLPA
jgi:catechol 2,3-dioxygenase-like lactoylglutathione lyase family enzyme